MPWLTLSQAAQRWLDAATWNERIESGQSESYVDGWGRRRVWIDPQDPLFETLEDLRGEVARLQSELSRLHTALEPVRPAAAPDSGATRRSGSGGQRRPPPPPLPEPLPATGGPSAQVAALLAQVDQRWEGSDRELERQAGLPLRFLTKARRGERNGERAQDSWARLQSFLRGARRAA